MWQRGLAKSGPVGSVPVTSGVLAIVAGNPARIVRPHFEGKNVRRLLRVAWLDWRGRTTSRAHPKIIMAGQPEPTVRELSPTGAPSPVFEALSAHPATVVAFPSLSRRGGYPAARRCPSTSSRRATGGAPAHLRFGDSSRDSSSDRVQGLIGQANPGATRRRAVPGEVPCHRQQGGRLGASRLPLRPVVRRSRGRCPGWRR